MPFKIVQTMERGIVQLSIVPATWEANGQLYWPPKNIKNKGLLIKDEKSMPSLNWDVLDCLVKRKDISLQEAEAEIKNMQNNTDTDSDVNNVTVTPTYHRVPLTDRGVAQNQSEIINFDEYAETLANIPETETPVSVSTEEPASLSNSIENIVNNQKKIAQKLAELSVKQDESTVRIVEKLETPVTLLQDVRPEESESFTIKQIDDQTQLELLEILLSDQSERKKLKNRLTFLCSPAQGHGKTFSYKLLDVLMSRTFLCKCSWSGASRGEQSKVPLKNYKKFISFFYEMVHTWDSTFTVEETENFFKLILKNAVKRKAMKNLRASTKRNRQTENLSVG